MARRVYFAFDYRDFFKVNKVRRVGQFVGIAQAGFRGAPHWEKLKLFDRSVIQRGIGKSLINTSVTAVVVGLWTAARVWIRDELANTARGNVLSGVYSPSDSGHRRTSAFERVDAQLLTWDSQRLATRFEGAGLRASRR